MKPTEQKATTSKSGNWKNRLEAVTAKDPKSRRPLNALRMSVSVPSEVIALTTIQNFRGDTLQEFVYESNWVLLTREQLEHPRFQQHLAKSDSLTSLCKSMSERCVDVRRADVVAKPPKCQCGYRSSEDAKTKPRRNIFRRFIDSFSRIWRGFRRKLRHCFCKEPSAKTDEESGHSFTNDYLCR